MMSPKVCVLISVLYQRIPKLKKCIKILDKVDMNLILSMAVVLTLIGCERPQIELKKPSDLVVKPPQETLVWNHPAPTLRAGEAIPFNFTNGGINLTIDTNGLGTLDVSGLEYTPPMNTLPVVHTISAKDDEGNSGTNAIRVSNFSPGHKVSSVPKSFGAQNYATGVTQTTNGNIYISSIVEDSPGWERWAVFRSTDNGVSFTTVDEYVNDEEGESHPLAITSYINDIYVCGYHWDSISGYPEWIIRKSTNNGATWTTIDHMITPNETSLCQDIKVSPSGILYAAGEHGATNRIIKESTDGGQTWNVIFTLTQPDFINAMDFSPNGNLWFKTNQNRIFEGVYSAGWTFTQKGTVPGTKTSGYQVDHNLLVLSNTNLIAVSVVALRLVIQKSIDGGVNWVPKYTSPYNGKSLEIKQLHTGEIILPYTDLQTIPNPPFFPTTVKHSMIAISNDDGETWSATYDNTVELEENHLVLSAQDGKIHVFGEMKDYGQISHLVSNDAGANWTLEDPINYWHNLYQYAAEYLFDSLGNMWLTFDFIGPISNGQKEAFVTMKSSNNGQSWSISDTYVDPTTDLSSNCIAEAPNGDIYVGSYIHDMGGVEIIRKTTDGGSSWNTVDTSTLACASMTINSAGEIFNLTANGITYSIRRSLDSGANWANTTATFTSSDYKRPIIKSISDGSLWVSTIEGTFSAYEHVLYRSINKGDNFTEFSRTSIPGFDTNPNKIMERASSIYVIFPDGLKRTVDGGATWLMVYDNSLGEVHDFEFDSSDRLYVKTKYHQILAQNQFTGNFFMMFDYPLLNTLYGASIEKLVKCGSTSGICALMRYDISIEGSVHQFYPLTSPL